MPEILSWPAQDTARQRVIEQAAQVLRAGGLVVYPTDTVYGLGADAACPPAIQRIYGVKGRPDEKAIIWLVASVDDVRGVGEVDQRVERLAARFWPGALTIVLRRRLIPSPLTGERERGGESQATYPTGAPPTLGFRVPAHPVALALISALGHAVATTSANRSGQPSARTATEALTQIGDGVDLIIDAGPAPAGTESTVVDLSVDPPIVLREGAISQSEIAAVLGTALAQRERMSF